MPQHVYKEQQSHAQEVARQMQRGGTTAHDIGLRGDTHIPPEVAHQAVRVYTRMANREATRAQGAGETVSSATLHALLDDALDVAADTAPTARMHTTEEVQSPEAMPGWGDGKSAEPAELEEIDPTTDDRVFAVLDDGCNRTCHSAHWAKRAEERLRKLGRAVPWASRSGAAYTGIGGMKNLAAGRSQWG